MPQQLQAIPGAWALQVGQNRPEINRIPTNVIGPTQVIPTGIVHMIPNTQF